MKLLSVLLGSALPLVAWGATLDSSVVQLVQNFVDVIINPIITLAFTAAMLIFFWGLFQLVLNLANGGKGEEGKRHMLWGLIGLIIMFSVWGIINVIANSIGADAPTAIQGVEEI